MRYVIDIFVLLFVLAILLLSSGVIKDAVREYKKRKVEKKQTELADVQKRILEFSTSIIQMTADVRSMDRAEDYSTDAWNARRAKRSAAIDSDRVQLYHLEERERRLKRELKIAPYDGDQHDS